MINFVQSTDTGRTAATQVKSEPVTAPRQILPHVTGHFNIVLAIVNIKKSIIKFIRKNTSIYNS